ncbi:MAG: DUF3958 family protein [Bacteroides faecis]|uniref:Uncharacterized protein n=1 Tax=Bacteroides faecis TaxID=674529 RepID=A0A6N2V815_9BACE
MKKYLFKVNFIMHASILGKDYEQKGTKHILVEAENYDTASNIVYESMKKAYCCFQVEDAPCERQKIRRLYDALDKFSRDANEVSAAWLELDESVKAEEELSDTLTKYFPKEAISVSFDDFAHDVSEWNRKVQEKIIKN